jgi:hypothetical protein
VREFKRKRGFLTIAQNSSIDYVRLAYALAMSLKTSQSTIPWLSIIVTPGTEIEPKYRDVFDEIIEVPWGDAAEESAWKLENEWKAYHVSPYEETIKLDADMLFSEDISAWWDILAKQDVWISTAVETYRGETITSDHYRRVFTDNELPNIYTAFMYFKHSDHAQQLFDMVDTIWNNWDDFVNRLTPQTRQPQTTDVVFAMAVKILDAENTMTFSGFPIPRFVHMKTKLQNWPETSNDDWTKHVDLKLHNDGSVHIGVFQQTLPVHYHVKSALTDDIISKYERLLDARPYVL